MARPVAHDSFLDALRGCIGHDRRLLQDAHSRGADGRIGVGYRRGDARESERSHRRVLPCGRPQRHSLHDLDLRACGCLRLDGQGDRRGRRHCGADAPCVSSADAVAGHVSGRMFHIAVGRHLGGHRRGSRPSCRRDGRRGRRPDRHVCGGGDRRSLFRRQPVVYFRHYPRGHPHPGMPQGRAIPRPPAPTQPARTRTTAPPPASSPRPPG